MNMKGLISASLLLVLSTQIQAQQPADTTRQQGRLANWYEKINIRGYMQLRYNRLLETNSNLQCDQCDRSWGGDGGFFLRRIRLILFGQLHPRLYFYIQPDFASSPDGNNNNFGQIRDAYFDLGLDAQNEFRLRFGQSKIPFGFENMQSSQNRLPLDRNDAINSAFSNERDLGVFFYWAPRRIRERFAMLVSSGLKGSGDYGVFAIGAFNGQTANRNEQNDQPHVVTRISYPFLAGKRQIIEPGLQAYTGRFVVANVSTGVAGKERFEYLDRRAAASLVIYPQPIGFSAEYNVGTGPEYSPSDNTILQKRLSGGYVMLSRMITLEGQKVLPFGRYHHYEGGKKFERDARSYTVNELEFGAEWQPFRNVEFCGMYTISDRRFEDGLRKDNRQNGSLLRLQVQLNL
jgi:hypothetical protein